MLGRLTSLSARVTPKALAPLAARSFHSTKPVFNTITAEERKGPTGTIVDTPGVIDQYGTIPFFGLLATALITKEVFIFNEEAILAMNTVAAATVGYIAIGDAGNKFFDGEREADNNRFHDSFSAAIEQVSLYKSIEAKKLEKVGVIRDLCRESRECNAAYLKFLNVKVRHDARAAMISRLEAIKKREAGEEAAEYQEFVTDTLDTLREIYADPANTAIRNASLEFAIANLGDVKSEENDPFREQLYKVMNDAESDAE